MGKVKNAMGGFLSKSIARQGHSISTALTKPSNRVGIFPSKNQIGNTKKRLGCRKGSITDNINTNNPETCEIPATSMFLMKSCDVVLDQQKSTTCHLVANNITNNNNDSQNNNTEDFINKSSTKCDELSTNLTELTGVNNNNAIKPKVSSGIGAGEEFQAVEGIQLNPPCPNIGNGDVGDKIVTHDLVIKNPHLMEVKPEGQSDGEAWIRLMAQTEEAIKSLGMTEDDSINNAEPGPNLPGFICFNAPMKPSLNGKGDKTVTGDMDPPGCLNLGPAILKVLAPQGPENIGPLSITALHKNADTSKSFTIQDESDSECFIPFSSIVQGNSNTDDRTTDDVSETPQLSFF